MKKFEPPAIDGLHLWINLSIFIVIKMYSAVSTQNIRSQYPFSRMTFKIDRLLMGWRLSQVTVKATMQC